MCLGAKRVRVGKRDPRKTRGANATCNSGANEDQGPILPAQPRPPGAVPASRGQQLGGRVLARDARRRPAPGDPHFKCGARDSRSSLPVPDPVAIAHIGPGFGEWVCVGRGRRRGPGDPARRRKAEGAPRVLGREGEPGFRGPRAEGDLRSRYSVTRPILGPAPSAPGASPADTASHSRGLISAGPLGYPARPRRPGFRGHDLRPTSAKVCLPPTLPASERGQYRRLSRERSRLRFALPPSRTAAAAWAWAGPRGRRVGRSAGRT